MESQFYGKLLFKLSNGNNKYSELTEEQKDMYNKVANEFLRICNDRAKLDAALEKYNEMVKKLDE